MPRTSTVTAPPIERQTSAPLVSQIVERLEEMIFSGAIDAGRKLNELTISKQFGVSRTALREAVRLLEQAGLVVVEPGRGVFVRRISVKQALDLFDVRAGFARTAGRLAALRASEAQIGELDALHAAMMACRTALDFPGYFDLNTRFHAVIFAAAGNERLTLLNEMINNELNLFNRRNMARAPYLDISIQEHERILTCIRSRDGERAARAFERHVLGGRQRMLEMLPEDSAA
ncbi:GntR family transcriptional regulator [Roseixanthobacter liquoris]|uniref:GntR family transcriptional regulator n=1 Tax=Roseixanthobacter liquoris TaxID=3119921 RepID=UPI00372CAC60